MTLIFRQTTIFIRGECIWDVIFMELVPAFRKPPVILEIVLKVANDIV
jgi:hypothetical protein